MEDGIEIRPHSVNREMKRQLTGWLMRAFTGSVRADADDVFSGKRAFIDPGRRDPYISVGVPDGKISAGHGRHALVVNTLHEHDKLVSRMNVLNIHTDFRLSF